MRGLRHGLDWQNAAERATMPPVTKPPVTKPPVTKPPVTKPPVTKPSGTKPAGRAARAVPAANRLPRAVAPLDRGREIRLGLFGALGLALLVIGVPVALWLSVGYPLPATAPSRDWLTATLTATLIINILACVVWVVWAHFVICIAAEWRAVRRGRLPGTVPLGGGSQLVARRLVAAVLLLAGAAALVPHGGSSPAPRFAAATVSAVEAGAQTGAQARVASPSAALAVKSSSVATAPAAKYYVVAPPDGRRYDSLWDIADRTLGNSLRYNEIFALNKDRVQSDGSTLLDANLIRPGWQLTLPADASGPGVEVVHAAPSPAVAAAPSAVPAPGRPAGASHLPSFGANVAAGQTLSASSGTGMDATSLAVGGGLMLAGLALAMSTRRGPYVEASQDESIIGQAADPDLARLLDRELRRLAAGRAVQGRSLPHPVLAYVSADRLVLQLAGGDAIDPPAPWELSEDHRSWTLAVQAGASVLADVAAPFPGLVSVGRSHGFELFVDLEQAPGLISIAGDLARAREVVTALAVQAATSIWSDGVRVSMVGFGDGAELSEIDPSLIVQAARLDLVLAEIEHERADLLDLQRRLGVDGVLTGRQSHRGDEWRPHLIVLSGPPTSQEAIRLQALIGIDRSSYIAVTVGEAAEARWRFAVDAAGTLELGVLGTSAQAHLLTRATSARLVELMRQAAADKRAQNSAVSGLLPAQAAASARSRPVAVGFAPDGAAAVEVSVLGPVRVSAPGPLDPAKLGLATEVVVAAALNRDGLHDAVLRASIWPRGVSDEVVEATLADVRAWLGQTPDGLPRLRHDADGQWRLSDDVRTDWDVLRQVAAAAGGTDELAALRRAVRLFRGEAFSGTSRGRYGWLAFGRAARDARVVATTVTRRAAALLIEERSVIDAEDALRRGLALLPTAELLWRDLLVIAGWSGPGGASMVADQMYDALRARHARPEPETDALVAQLAPGYRRGRRAMAADEISA
jgi:nucleoid-associated protein YgaU